MHTRRPRGKRGFSDSTKYNDYKTLRFAAAIQWVGSWGNVATHRQSIKAVPLGDPNLWQRPDM